MFYSPLVRKACDILFEAHAGDRDKGGYPYVFHPFYVAAQLNDEVSVCVALLHDVIEDHGDRYSITYLESMGFPREVTEALRLLTHGEGIPYMDYVRLIGENETASRVKKEDLKHNLNAQRTDGVPTKKEKLYREALAYLNERYPGTQEG